MKMEREEIADTIYELQEISEQSESAENSESSEQSESSESAENSESSEQSESSESAENSESSEQSECSELSAESEKSEKPSPAEAELQKMIEKVGPETLLDIIKDNRNAAIRQIISEVEASQERTLPSGSSVSGGCSSIFDLAALA